jgi:hypothetical protein
LKIQNEKNEIKSEFDNYIKENEKRYTETEKKLKSINEEFSLYKS